MHSLSAAGHKEVNWRCGCVLWVWDPALETFEETYSPKWSMHPGEAQVLLSHLGSLESLLFFLLSKNI